MTEILITTHRSEKQLSQPDKRAQWLRDYGELVAELESRTWNSDTSLNERMDAIAREYERTLVDVAVSRCPFCKTIVTMSWDPVGIDGLWWCYRYPSRGPRKPVCEHFSAVVGAVTLPETPPHTPYLVKPGPGVPFVVPLVLGGLTNDEEVGVGPEDFDEIRRSASTRPTVRAVVSKLEVGGLAAYAIHYFGQPVLGDQPILPSWSADDHGTSLYVSPSQQDRTVRRYFDDDCDFELQPWLDEGFIQWIAPGDDSLTLQAGASHCPYLNLSGARSNQYLQEGTLWLHSDGWAFD